MKQTDEVVKISARNIALNLILASIKIFAGLFSNSLAVLSDGLNSLSDVATSIVVLVSNHFTSKPQDREHPYGHEKFESVATLIIALFLGSVALVTIYESIRRLIHGSEIHQSQLALGATILSATVKYFMYRSTRKKATELRNDALNLVAVDFRFDVFLSISVFVGVFVAMLGLWFFEPVAAIFASILLLISAVRFMMKASSQLVDTAADEETVEMIRRTALACQGVRSIDLLMTRQHGNFIYVDIEVSVDPYISVLEGHSIAECVHDKLEGELTHHIKHCNVHINPDLPDENE